MAEALFRSLLSPADLPDWRIESAGTRAFEGQPAAPPAVQAMARRGLDLRRHRSREVSAGLLAQFNLVLVMEPGHKEALQVEFPSQAAKIYLLSEMTGASFPIADPYGGPPAVYEATAAGLLRLLAAARDRIFQLASAPARSAP